MSDTVQRIFQLMEQRHVSAYRVSQETGLLPCRPARQFAGAAYRRGRQGPGSVSCVSPFALWQRKGPGQIMIQSVLTP